MPKDIHIFRTIYRVIRSGVVHEKVMTGKQLPSDERNYIFGGGIIMIFS